MEKKLTSRQKQAIATKKKIYKTGVTMFKEHGYHNVSVEEIAKKAGVGVGTFYHYYKSKLELYTELFINAEDYFEEFRHMDLTQEDMYTVLQRYFQQYARLNEEPGLEFAQMLSNPSGRSVLEGNQDFEKQLEEMIVYFQKSGQMIDDRSAAELCDYFFVCARGVLFDWSIKNGNFDLKTKMHSVMDYFIAGVTKR